MQYVRYVWCLSLFAVLFVSCDFGYRQENEILRTEKMLLEQELSTLIEKYDNAIALNEVMDDHLIAAKMRIVRLLDSIQKLESRDLRVK